MRKYFPSFTDGLLRKNDFNCGEKLERKETPTRELIIKRLLPRSLPLLGRHISGQVEDE
jgi:hypothetical protein